MNTNKDNKPVGVDVLGDPAPRDCTETGEYVSYWKDVLTSLKQNGKVMLYTNLIGTKAKEINDMTIGIEFASGGSSFGRMVIEKPENMQIIKKAIIQFAGKDMNIKCIDKADVGAASSRPQKIEQSTHIEDTLKDLDLPINIIED